MTGYYVNLVAIFGKWKCKFDCKTNNNLQVDGTSDAATIVGNFAKHFEKTCIPLSSARNNEFKALFVYKRSVYYELLPDIARTLLSCLLIL